MTRKAQPLDNCEPPKTGFSHSALSKMAGLGVGRPQKLHDATQFASADLIVAGRQAKLLHAPPKGMCR
jgi:hypothetical protein